jgi:hypothetical protein
MAQANAHPTSVARTAPVITLAKFYARKRVIADAQPAGIRYRGLSSADITRSAVEYLHGPHGPELVARATETLAEWAERDRIRKEMLRRRRAQLRNSVQSAKA